MGFREFTPVASGALLNAQSGAIHPPQVTHLNVAGGDLGYNGTGTQSYTEYLFGKECGNYTSADNTSGTKYYPETEYIISIKNLVLYFLTKY